MLTSLKKITNEMKVLCDAHPQIKSFHYGEFLDIIKSDSIEYTTTMMNCIQSNFDPDRNTTTLVLDVMVMDKIYKDRSNNNDVENTTLLILRDLVGVIWRSPRWQELGTWSSISIASKFIEKGADVVTGWGCSITIDVVDGYGYCDTPVSGYNFEV